MYDQYCLFFGLTLIFHKESISLFAAYKDSQKIYLRSTERSFRTLAMPMLRINRLKKGLKFCANVRNLKTTQNTQLCVIKPSPTYFTFLLLLQSFNNVYWKVKVHEHIETILLGHASMFFNFLCRRTFILITTQNFQLLIRFRNSNFGFITEFS